jgi:hypothetical protein
VNGNDPMQVGAQFQAIAHSILSAIIKVSLSDYLDALEGYTFQIYYPGNRRWLPMDDIAIIAVNVIA